jgi:hypothetical protein
MKTASAFLLLVLASPAMAQVPPVFVVSNDKLELSVATQGGSMIRLLLQGDADKLNPFGDPEKLTLKPAPARPPQALGHFVCVDGFGPVSAEERKAGLSQHGEAHLLPWEIVSSGKQGAATTVKFSVKLPLVQEIFTRTLTLVDGESVVYVDSELESLLGFDRPVNWGEHATIASPFLDSANTVVDLSSTRSQTRPYNATESVASRRKLAPGVDFTWPMAPLRSGGALVDLRPVPAGANSMDHTTTLFDPTRKLAFVTALNPARQCLLGYLLRSDEFPWIQQWMSYMANGWYQRGLEFATQPYDVPRREAISQGKLFDTATFRWLPARSKITSRFVMFYTKTPPGMSKIDDVRMEGGKIIIEDRAAGRQVVLAASLPL